MNDRLQELEDRLERLNRYIELVDKQLAEIREMIETRTEIDSAERVLKGLSRVFKRNKNDN